MKYFLFIMAFFISLSSIAARHKIFKRHIDIVKKPDTVWIYTIGETPVDPKLHDTTKSYIGNYLITNAKALDSVQTVRLQKAVIQKENYFFNVAKRCPFIAKWAIEFRKGGRKVIIIVSPANCSKVQVYLPNNTQPTSFDLAEKNGIEATVSSLANKQ